MENPNCKNCKYFDDRCQNYRLTHVDKSKRLNGAECEFWEEKIQAETSGKPTRQVLLDIAAQLEKIAFSLKDGEE